MRSASGVLSPVRRLSGYNVVHLAAAIGPAGDATVAWARSESRDVRVAAVRLSADGAAGVSTVLSATGARAYEPAVAMDAAGRAHIAYVRDGQLMLRTRSTSGGYGAARALAAGTWATSPRLVAGSDGQIEIAWMRPQNEDAGDVLARTLNADSTLTATQTLGAGLIERTGGTTVGLVAGGQGRSVVVWTSTASGKPTVELRRRTSTTLAAPERLRLTPQRVFRPLVATNADGQVAAAWTERVAATDTQASYDRVLGRNSGP